MYKGLEYVKKIVNFDTKLFNQLTSCFAIQQTKCSTWCFNSLLSSSFNFDIHNQVKIYPGFPSGYCMPING